MLILRDPAHTQQVTDPDIRRLIEQRFKEISAGEAYDTNRHGYMVVVEPGDSVTALEQECSRPILRSLFDDFPYGSPDFAPSFDILEEHHGSKGTVFYEMHFDTNDDGFGITLFLPKEGIDADLLALCAEYATPAHVSP